MNDLNRICVEDVILCFQEEISKWDFFSDSQRACLDENNRIVVCLRNYNWYITKNEITDTITAIKALFEIMWIAEFDDIEDDSNISWIKYSKYWEQM